MRDHNICADWLQSIFYCYLLTFGKADGGNRDYLHKRSSHKNVIIQWYCWKWQYLLQLSLCKCVNLWLARQFIHWDPTLVSGLLSVWKVNKIICQQHYCHWLSHILSELITVFKQHNWINKNWLDFLCAGHIKLTTLYLYTSSLSLVKTTS